MSTTETQSRLYKRRRTISLWREKEICSSREREREREQEREFNLLLGLGRNQWKNPTA
jgi:hypothetical protein